MSDMIPSPITENQIGKMNEIFSAKLRKAELQSGPVQQVLEYRGGQLAVDLLAVVQQHVDAESTMISRNTVVDRFLSPQQALEATGRKQYLANNVVKTMSNGKGDKAEVFFFNLGCWISDDDLGKEYVKRGLVPCDSHTLSKVNQDDPTFADDHPNCTYWKDGDGRWCFAIFFCWLGERRVYVYHDDDDWDGAWWFAGVRK